MTYFEAPNLFSVKYKNTFSFTFSSIISPEEFNSGLENIFNHFLFAFMKFLVFLTTFFLKSLNVSHSEIFTFT
jgi:hypothetical protein